MASINIKFSYRTKLGKVLNEGNRQLVNESFMQFCLLEMNMADKILWDLDSGEAAATDAALKYLGLESISRENVSILKDELQYQYEKIHGKCLNVSKILEKWKPAYVELMNHTNQSVANAVLERCKFTLEMDVSMIERVLYLLNSDYENYYFGGLRKMGFKFKEADYLKPYRMYVRKLLVAMGGE